MSNYPPGVSDRDFNDDPDGERYYAEMAEREQEEEEARNPEWLCDVCGKREAIISGLCGMCSELHPNRI